MSKEYERRANHCCGVRERFINATKQVVDDHNKRDADKHGQVPPSSSSASQQTPQASETAPSTPPEETARAREDVAPEEPTRASASVMPEVTAPTSSSAAAPTTNSSLKLITLPSASEAKKTKAAERAALKKRKSSDTLESSAPKKVKTLTSSYENPIDVVPLSSMPSKEIVPFGEEYVIPSESDEEDPSAATLEQIDEEIEVDNVTSTPLVSSPMPQFTAEEAGVEEIDEEYEDVDIGSTTPVLNDDYWERNHPNSPFTTPLHQIPQSPVQTKEIHT